jgi:hypothetical protein
LYNNVCSCPVMSNLITVGKFRIESGKQRISSVSLSTLGMSTVLATGVYIQTRSARGTLERACCVHEPPAGLFAVVVDIGLAVGDAPRIECPPSPHGLQSLIELAKYAVVAEEGCYADDLARRPDSSVVIPPMGTDQFGAMKQVAAAPLSLGLGRSAEHA